MEIKNLEKQLFTAASCIEKMLMSGDRKTLDAFAVFLTGCYNTIQDVESADKMTNPSNMKQVIFKLFVLTRER